MVKDFMGRWVENCACRPLKIAAYLLLTVSFFVTADNNVVTPNQVVTKQSTVKRKVIRKKSKKAAPDNQTAAAPAVLNPGPTLPEIPSSDLLKRSEPHPASPVLFAILETRPSWLSSENRWYMENFAEIGFKWPNYSLSYQQQFLNNLFNASGLIGNGNFVINNGFIRFKANDLITHPNGLSFSWEPRVYMPTNPLTSGDGFITAIRNYFKINWEFSKSFSMLAYEVPIFHFYSKPGVGNTANPFFENRMIFAATYKFLDNKAEFTFPVFMSFTVHSDYQPTAKFNADWEHHLWIYPELLYSVTPKVKVGLAYQTGDIIDVDFTQLVVDHSFHDGIAQFVFQVNF